MRKKWTTVAEEVDDSCPAGWERIGLLPYLLDNGCAARWERIGLLGGRIVGQRLRCWIGEVDDSCPSG